MRKEDVHIGDLLCMKHFSGRGYEFCRVIGFSPTGLPRVLFFNDVKLIHVYDSVPRYEKLEDSNEPTNEMYAKRLSKGKGGRLTWCGKDVYHYDPYRFYYCTRPLPTATRAPELCMTLRSADGTVLSREWLSVKEHEQLAPLGNVDEHVHTARNETSAEPPIQQ